MGLQRARKPAKIKTCCICGRQTWRSSEFIMINAETGEPHRFHRQCAKKEVEKNPEKWKWVNIWETL